MSKLPTELKYATTHEWVRVEGDIATVGITDHAQEAMGDLVYVELPEVGDEVKAADEAGVVESVTPLECGLAWTVAFEPSDRAFTGRGALEAMKASPRPGETTGNVAPGLRKTVGLVLEGRGVLRSHLAVRLADGRSGETTSGTFSPTLGVAIALARIPATSDSQVEVEIRGKWHVARIVKPPFVRNGKVLV